MTPRPSTETRSGSLAAEEGGSPASAGEYYASIADPLQFLTLAWECSVVGGPETVRQGLEAFVARTRADELMLVNILPDHAARTRGSG